MLEGCERVALIDYDRFLVTANRGVDADRAGASKQDRRGLGSALADGRQLWRRSLANAPIVVVMARRDIVARDIKAASMRVLDKPHRG